MPETFGERGGVMRMSRDVQDKKEEQLEAVVEISENKKEIFSEQLLREGRVLEQILEVEYAFLEPEHDVTQFLQGRLQHLFPDREFAVRVADNETEPNALALPNGTIIVTKGLLRLAETQDELDFVLAHEAAHIIKGHAAEVAVVLDEAKQRYQTKDKVGSLIRLLGVKRLAEYEADIEGVMELSGQRVNPAAARSFFLKMEAFEQQQHYGGSSLEHGNTIGRLVNIGAFAMLFDSEATLLEQVPIPQLVKEYADTVAEGWLFGDIATGMTEKEIRTSAKRASLKELLLTVSQTWAAYGVVSEDPMRRREMENYEFFHAIVGDLIAKRVAEGLPDRTDEERSWIVHGLLTMVVGLRPNDDADSPFGRFLSSLDNLSSDAEVWKKLNGLTPETFEQLGVVAPSADNIVCYIHDVVQSANEHGLFITADDTFDVQAYLQFVARLVDRAVRLSGSCSFRQLHPADFTEMIVT